MSDPSSALSPVPEPRWRVAAKTGWHRVTNLDPWNSLPRHSYGLHRGSVRARHFWFYERGTLCCSHKSVNSPRRVRIVHYSLYKFSGLLTLTG